MVLKGNSPENLAIALNDYFSDNRYDPEQKKEAELTPVSSAYVKKRKLKIWNAQQYTIGEVMKGVLNANNQPPVQYSFCILLICSYE